MGDKKIEVELVRSINGTPRTQRRIATALALKRVHDKRVVPDNGATRGMVKKISHLVVVREL